MGSSFFALRKLALAFLLLGAAGAYATPPSHETPDNEPLPINRITLRSTQDLLQYLSQVRNWAKRSDQESADDFLIENLTLAESQKLTGVVDALLTLDGSVPKGLTQDQRALLGGLATDCRNSAQVVAAIQGRLLSIQAALAVPPHGGGNEKKDGNGAAPKQELHACFKAQPPEDVNQPQERVPAEHLALVRELLDLLFEPNLEAVHARLVGLSLYEISSLVCLVQDPPRGLAAPAGYNPALWSRGKRILLEVMNDLNRGFPLGTPGRPQVPPVTPKQTWDLHREIGTRLTASPKLVANEKLYRAVPKGKQGPLLSATAGLVSSLLDAPASLAHDFEIIENMKSRPYLPVGIAGPLARYLELANEREALQKAFYETPYDFEEAYEQFQQRAANRIDRLIPFLDYVERPSRIPEEAWTAWLRTIREYLVAARAALFAERPLPPFDGAEYKKQLSTAYGTRVPGGPPLPQILQGADRVAALETRIDHVLQALDELPADEANADRRAYYSSVYRHLSEDLQRLLGVDGNDGEHTGSISGEPSLGVSEECRKAPPPSAAPKEFRNQATLHRIFPLFVRCRMAEEKLKDAAKQGKRALTFEEHKAISALVVEVGSFKGKAASQFSCNYFRPSEAKDSESGFPPVLLTHFEKLFTDPRCLHVHGNSEKILNDVGGGALKLVGDVGEGGQKNSCTREQQQAIQKQDCLKDVACQVAHAAVAGSGPIGYVYFAANKITNGKVAIPGCGNTLSKEKNCADAVVNGIIGNLWQTVYSFYEIPKAIWEHGSALVTDPVGTLKSWNKGVEGFQDSVAGFAIFMAKRQARQLNKVLGPSDEKARQQGKMSVGDLVVATHRFLHRRVAPYAFAHDTAVTGFEMAKDAVQATVREIEPILRRADVFGILEKAEGRARNIYSIVSRLEQSALNEFLDNPLDFLKTFAEAATNLLWQMAVSQFGCIDPPFHQEHITECRVRVPAWNCATCNQRTSVFCEMAGFIGGEVIQQVAMALLTAGAANAARAGVGGLSWLGKALGSTRSVQAVAGIFSKAKTLATASKTLGPLVRIGEKTAELVKDVGRALYNTGKAGFKSIAVPIENLDHFMRKVPGVGHYMKFTDELTESVVGTVFRKTHLPPDIQIPKTKGARGPPQVIVTHSPGERVSAASKLLERKLTPKQIEAIERAHLVGAGQLGKDGTLACHGNYTQAQLREKVRILQEAGFSREEIGLLLRRGICGTPALDAARAAERSAQAALDAAHARLGAVTAEMAIPLAELEEARRLRGQALRAWNEAGRPPTGPLLDARNQTQAALTTAEEGIRPLRARQNAATAGVEEASRAMVPVRRQLREARAQNLGAHAQLPPNEVIGHVAAKDATLSTPPHAGGQPVTGSRYPRPTNTSHEASNIVLEALADARPGRDHAVAVAVRPNGEVVVALSGSPEGVRETIEAVRRNGGLPEGFHWAPPIETLPHGWVVPSVSNQPYRPTQCAEPRLFHALNESGGGVSGMSVRGFGVDRPQYRVPGAPTYMCPCPNCHLNMDIIMRFGLPQ